MKPSAPFLLCCLGAVIVVLVFAIIGQARGHDEHDWIRQGGYRNGGGEWCCGKDDCAVVPAAELEPLKGGDWLIMPTGERVPAHEVLPSQDGRFWVCRRPNRSIRCFFQPPGTS